jgi:phosphopantetheinyl transferase
MISNFLVGADEKARVNELRFFEDRQRRCIGICLARLAVMALLTNSSGQDDRLSWRTIHFERDAYGKPFLVLDSPPNYVSLFWLSSF